MIGFFVLPLVFIATAPVFAVTFQYVYDDTRQLVKAIDSNGNIVEYVYDELGNRLEVKRYTISGLAIHGFTPSTAPVGSTVTIQGQGFSVNPLDNIVTIGGVQVTVISATEYELVVIIPEGLPSGDIVVTVNGISATASKQFAVSPGPVITAIDPKFITSESTQDTVWQSVTITGHNLTLSDFSFLPTFSPSRLQATAIAIAANGESATFNITILAGTTGSFVIRASNSSGNSDSLSSSSNTLVVFDVNADSDSDLLTDYAESQLCTHYLNPDSDGDGYTDKDETDFNFDPCDQNTKPVIMPNTTAPGAMVSIVNSTTPPVASFANQAGDNYLSSSMVSIVNAAPVPVGNFSNGSGARVVSTSVFSIINTTIPVPGGYTTESGKGAVSGTTFSVINRTLPLINTYATESGTGKVSSPAFSVVNTAIPVSGNFATKTGKGVAGGPVISIQNGN